MLSIERQQLILDLISKKGSISTNELASTLSVSLVTIRNDLNKLSKSGLIKKTHGGASALCINDNIEELTQFTTFSTRESTNELEKDIISEYAVSLIKDNQCILLDASSTALALAKKLSRFKKLLVITNGIYTMMALKDLPNVNVIMIGGMVTKNSGSIEGLIGAEMLNKLHIDIAFVSARGFNIEEGCTDFNIYEVELKKVMLKKCNKTIVLLDSSKFGYVSSSSFLSTKNIDLIITDNKIKPEYLNLYQKEQINIKICS